MTSIKGWTAVLKGYFDTTILPKIAHVAPHPLAGQLRSRDVPTLAKVRLDLQAMLKDQYGDLALEENAQAALKAYKPGWWTESVTPLGTVHRWHTWDEQTGVMTFEDDDK